MKTDEQLTEELVELLNTGNEADGQQWLDALSSEERCRAIDIVGVYLARLSAVIKGVGQAFAKFDESTTSAASRAEKYQEVVDEVQAISADSPSQDWREHFDMEESDMNKVWVVGQYKGQTERGAVWELQGVFSSYENAVAACVDRNYFIFPPAHIDEKLPHESIIPDGVTYPRAESNEK